MSEATKIKNGVLIECDCGLNHKVTMENKELKLKTTYSKKIEKPENEKPETKKEEQKNEKEENEPIWFE